MPNQPRPGYQNEYRSDPEKLALHRLREAARVRALTRLAHEEPMSWDILREAKILEVCAEEDVPRKPLPKKLEQRARSRARTALREHFPDRAYTLYLEEVDAAQKKKS